MIIPGPEKPDQEAVLDLASAISSSFIHSRSVPFESLVTAALRQVVQALSLGSASLVFFNETGDTSSYQFPPLKSGPAPPSQLDELPLAATRELKRGSPVFVQAAGSSYWLPLMREKRLIGHLVLRALRDHAQPPDELMRRLRILQDLFTYAVNQHTAGAEIDGALQQVRELKSQFEYENSQLMGQYKRRHAGDTIIAESQQMKEVLRLVETVGPTESVVLLQGETGTGKELIGRRIHSLSSRRNRPMLAVNCAALPSALIEGELFGRERGAFTGALTRQAGRFEAAHGSTLFLDEVGELGPDLQAKLLRVLQEGRFERLGSTRTIQADVRIIAATNRDLVAAVEAGEFRRDLFYRLNVFPISMAPLRERTEDIPPMVWMFAEQFGQAMRRLIERIPRETMERLVAHAWPGNARELRNAVERAMILSEGGTLHVEVPGAGLPSSQARRTLEEVQRDRILEAMTRTAWRIRGPGGAANLLGLKPTTLESRMKKLGIQRPPRPAAQGEAGH